MSLTFITCCYLYTWTHNSQEERPQEWKEHFRNQLGKSEITDKPTEEIIYGQIDIKLRKFTEAEHSENN